MRLINFLKSDNFFKLREKMGIKKDRRPNFDTKLTWNPFELEELNTRGLDLSLDEIDICKDGTLEYRDKKMVLYIRDRNYRYKEKSSYKYHISWCSVLQRMKNENRFGRYVVSQRKDGLFMVNFIDTYKNVVIEENVPVEMNVCKPCLAKLNYKNYNSNGHLKDEICDNFSLKHFFEKYDSKIHLKPKYNSGNAPLNKYTKDWPQVSRRYRMSKGWKCEECGRDFSNNTRSLHAHHIDGDKTNNDRSNLKALCDICHSEQPYHEHMKHG